MFTSRRLWMLAGLATGVGSPAFAQVLYSNGPLVTTPTGSCLPPATSASEVQAGDTVIGFGNSTAFGERLADEFTVTDLAGWSLTGFDFYAYQTGSTTASPITQVSVQVWSGRPGDPGAVVVAGDGTNRLVTSTFAGIYRYAN